MAGPEIKLDVSDLQSTLNKLRKSIDDFESYTTTFRSNTRDRLKPFNSDFIEKVDALLDNMNDDANTDLINKVNKIHNDGEELLQNMKDADEQLGQAIRGDSS